MLQTIAKSRVARRAQDFQVRFVHVPRRLYAAHRCAAANYSQCGACMMNHVVQSAPCRGPASEPAIDIGYELSRGFAAGYIRRAAQRLARQIDLPEWEAEDLEQQLKLELLESLTRFDPRQGCFDAFVTVVVQRDVSHRHRMLSRQCRERDGQQSLESSVTDGDGILTQLGDELACDVVERRTGRWSIARDEEVELSHDVQIALAKLPSRLRHVAYLLLWEAPADVARRLRVSRTTIHNLVEKIRKHWTDLELQPNPKKLGLR
jgi:RNA polymerase sigma factor (sigma-70 family)